MAAVTVLVAAFAMLVPAVGSAQDPGYDQYAPTPGTGGNENPSPSGVDGTPVPASGTDDGSDDSSGTGDSGATAAPTGTPDETTTDTSGAATGSGHDGDERAERKDDRTLDGLAANAADQRNQRRGDDVVRAAQLSSSTDGGSGMGALLWIAIGAIVLWAVVMGFRNLRGGNFGKTTGSESTT